MMEFETCALKLVPFFPEQVIPWRLSHRKGGGAYKRAIFLAHFFSPYAVISPNSQKLSPPSSHIKLTHGLTELTHGLTLYGLVRGWEGGDYEQ